jgi:quaternary ammonium compound-resistance protein SugE
MAWILLVAAGLLEIVWATAVKQSDGLTRLWPSVIGIGGAAVSFVLLSAALRSLPVGTAYAVWVGIGALGVALAGVALQGEPASPVRAAFLVLILVGVIGLRALDGA